MTAIGSAVGSRRRRWRAVDVREQFKTLTV